MSKRGRLDAVPYFAQAITDPDEIWLQVRADQAGRLSVGRTYIRVADIEGVRQGLAVGLELGGKWWQPSTAYLAGRGARPDVDALKSRRSGKLIWKRKV